MSEIPDELYCHDEGDDGWEKTDVEPNEICPECKSHNIRMYQRCDYPQTWEQPAEYSFKGECGDCDDEFEFPDEAIQYGLT